MTDQHPKSITDLLGSMNETDKEIMGSYLKQIREGIHSVSGKYQELVLLLRLSKKLSLLEAKKEADLQVIKMYKTMDEFLKARDETIFALIDKLVREGRVHKESADKIKKTILFVSQDLETVIKRIGQEIAKYDRDQELVSAFVNAVDKDNQPKPTLDVLSKASGFSRSECSKRLSGDPILLGRLLREVEKRMNQAKTDRRKELWRNTIMEIESYISTLAEKRYRAKERSTDSIENIHDRIDSGLRRQRRKKSKIT